MEKGWIFIYASGLIFSAQQFIFLLNIKVLEEIIVLLALTILSAGLYSLKSEWERILNSEVLNKT